MSHQRLKLNNLDPVPNPILCGALGPPTSSKEYLGYLPLPENKENSNLNLWFTKL